jgi:hypothetical protein
MPDLSADQAAELAAAVRQDEVQGALRTLLAVRLTDASATDAAQARKAVRLAVGGTSPSLDESLPAMPHTLCGALSEYLDERICSLVAKLEGRVGFAGLAQVRSEAYNARIVALLGAIERQVVALADPAARTQAEAEFLERYRRPTASTRHCSTSKQAISIGSRSCSSWRCAYQAPGRRPPRYAG